MTRKRSQTLLAYLAAERGRATRLARQLRVSEAIVSMWANGSRRIPAERCRQIHTFTKIPFGWLRPDLFKRKS